MPGGVAGGCQGVARWDAKGVAGGLPRGCQGCIQGVIKLDNRRVVKCVVRRGARRMARGCQ